MAERAAKPNKPVKDATDAKAAPKRQSGRLKGLVKIGPEFEPLPEEELKFWNGQDDGVVWPYARKTTAPLRASTTPHSARRRGATDPGSARGRCGGNYEE